MSREWVLWRDFPATGLLDQRQPIWRIPIDLVRAAEDERCLRTMLTSCLEQRECAVGVNGKVGDGMVAPPYELQRQCRDRTG
jgi:hypothetical protein